MMIVALALLFATGSAPADPPSAAATPQKAAVQDKDRVICKTWAPIGSLIANHKECRTRQDWDRMRLDTSHIVQGGSCNSAESGQCY